VFNQYQKVDEYVDSVFEQSMLGKVAPEFSLNMLNGRYENLAIYRNGKRAIIFFWSIKDQISTIQLKSLYRYKDDFEQRGIKIIIVNTKDDAEEVRSYLDKSQINFEVFLDKDGLITSKYKYLGPTKPYFHHLDEDGVIIEINDSIPKLISKYIYSPS